MWIGENIDPGLQNDSFEPPKRIVSEALGSYTLHLI